VTGAIAFLFFTGTYLVWRYIAHQKLEAEIRAIHARGEPILLEDFNSPPVPDELNAAVSYQSAVRAVAAMPPSVGDFLSDFEPTHEIDPTTRTQLRQAATAASSAASLARAARFRPQVNFNIKLGLPISSAFSDSTTIKLGRLGEILKLIAINEHLESHDCQTIETLRDLLRLSKALNHTDPLPLGPFVAERTSSAATEGIQLVVHNLRILPDSVAASQPAGPASRAQVRALIDELLAEDDFNDGFIRDAYTDRTFTYYELTDSPEVVLNIQSLPAKPLWRPYFESGALRGLRYMDGVAAAARNRSYPAVRDAMPSPDMFVAREAGTFVTGFAHFTDYAIGGYSARWVQTHFSASADRRAQAIALALRLYQLDHKNTYPARLEELVPQYLVAVPDDPFAAEKRPFGFKLSPRPMLFSVGVDGINNNGDFSFPPKLRSRENGKIPPGHMDDDLRLERADLLFLLGDPALKDVPQRESSVSEEESRTSPPESATQPATGPAEESPIETTPAGV
jgi:hypothetical protein